MLGGYSSSSASGDKTENSKGDLDYWIIKINASGVKQWDKTFGGSGIDELTSIVSTSDGGFLLGGSSQSPVSGDKTENRRGNVFFSDYWLVKINSNGIKQWDRTFGGSNSDQLRSIIATSDGGFILAGNSFSPASGDKTEAGRGDDQDYWVIKINASGVKQWDKTLGGTGRDALTSIVGIADGGFLLSGSSPSPISGDKTEISKGGEDYWVIKINASGVKQWDKAFGGVSGDYFPSIVSTSDGGFILAGTSSSPISGDKTEDSKILGSEDYWVIKINASGVKQWDKTLGGTGRDYLRSIIATSDGGFILTGNSFSPASGDKTENSKGSEDYWVIKIK